MQWPTALVDRKVLRPYVPYGTKIGEGEQVHKQENRHDPSLAK